jgi:O-antigen ligase
VTRAGPVMSAQPQASTPRLVLTVALAVVGAGLALVVADFAMSETYLLAIVGAVSLPIAALLYRRPIAAVALWVMIAPLVMVVDEESARRVFWFVHRMLPLAALGATLLGPVLGTTVRKLPRPGRLELLMFGYIAASLLSIAYTSPERSADVYLLYDRVAVPMMLFVVIRWIGPEDRTLDRWFPVLAVLVLSQTAFGIMSWVAPELLPDAWLNRAGSRTTGSLRHPNVYGISLLFGGALAFHLGRVAPRGSLRRLTGMPLLAIACLMAVLTLSRATWLATLVVLVGIACMHPRAVGKTLLLVVPTVALLLSSGLLGISTQGTSDRLYSSTSEESALSRLPVVMASVRMLEARPLTGWGYNRFDDFDHQFQEAIPGLYVPTKDHASHNLYLSILAEQGFVGLGLYLGPAFVLAGRSIRIRPFLRSRPRDRLQLMTLWLVLAGYLTVTMFSNMRVAFGFGVWWICLGLIAVVTDRIMSAQRDDEASYLDRFGAEFLRTPGGRTL